VVLVRRVSANHHPGLPTADLDLCSRRAAIPEMHAAEPYSWSPFFSLIPCGHSPQESIELRLVHCLEGGPAEGAELASFLCAGFQRCQVWLEKYVILDQVVDCEGGASLAEGHVFTLSFVWMSFDVL